MIATLPLEDDGLEGDVAAAGVPERVGDLLVRLDDLGEADRQPLRSRVGSSGQHVWTTAREQNAMVQSPWTMIPGRPMALAKSSSRWIGIGSPDAFE